MFTDSGRLGHTFAVAGDRASNLLSFDAVCMYILYNVCMYILYNVCMYILYNVCMYILYNVCLYILYNVCMYILYNIWFCKWNKMCFTVIKT